MLAAGAAGVEAGRLEHRADRPARVRQVDVAAPADRARSPAVGRTRPSSIRRVVVLPAPLGPRKPVTSPAATSKLRSRTAVTAAEPFGQAADGYVSHRCTIARRRRRSRRPGAASSGYRQRGIQPGPPAAYREAMNVVRVRPAPKPRVADAVGGYRGRGPRRRRGSGGWRLRVGPRLRRGSGGWRLGHLRRAARFHPHWRTSRWPSWSTWSRCSPRHRRTTCTTGSRLLFGAVACGALILRRRWPYVVLMVSTVGGRGVPGAVPAGSTGRWSWPRRSSRCTRWPSRPSRRRSLLIGVLVVLAFGGFHTGSASRPASSGRRTSPSPPSAGWPSPPATPPATAAPTWPRSSARAQRAEHDRDAEARRRVTEERLRIARDLHDSVGHHLALINVQAGVAAHVLTDQPDAAREAFAHDPGRRAGPRWTSCATRSGCCASPATRPRRSSRPSAWPASPTCSPRSRRAGLSITEQPTEGAEPVAALGRRPHRVPGDPGVADQRVQARRPGATSALTLDRRSPAVVDDHRWRIRPPTAGVRAGTASPACANGSPRSAAGCDAGPRRRYGSVVEAMPSAVTDPRAARRRPAAGAGRFRHAHRRRRRTCRWSARRATGREASTWPARRGPTSC